MAVYKRTNRSGKIVWMYGFYAPGSTRKDPKLIRESGFSTKSAATDAERDRRNQIDLQQKLAAVGSAALPTTLRGMLEEFFREHGAKALAPKTLERYQQDVEYLHADLLAMPIGDIRPLHFRREWNRLLESGGHHRKSKAARSLSKKTVRNIAGALSSAFSRAMRWGITATNPIKASEPPKPEQRQGTALTPAQHELLFNAAASVWGMETLLRLGHATGARRGELLALRWSDIKGDELLVSRSLCQTRAGLVFKATKSGKTRPIVLPGDAVALLERHRKTQQPTREMFGPSYHSDLDLVFCNPDGTPLHPDSVSSSISNLFRQLKIQKPKGAALHLLRHTHTSELLAAGVDLATVAARLGHSSPAVTAKIYAHMVQGRDRAAVIQWERFQAKQLKSEAAAEKPQ